MKLTSRTTFPPSGKEKGSPENEERESLSFLDEVSFKTNEEYLEKLSEFRELVLRRIRAHIDEDEKEEDNGEENDDD